MPRTYRLDAYYIADACAGLIEGVPTVEWLIGRAGSTVARIWGHNRPILMIPPEVMRDDLRMAIAYITGTVIDGDASPTSTHLWVVWFPRIDPLHPIRESIDLVSERGGWGVHAKPHGI